MTTGSYVGLPPFNAPLVTRGAGDAGDATVYVAELRGADDGLVRNPASGVETLCGIHLRPFSAGAAAALKPFLHKDVAMLTAQTAALRLVELASPRLSSWKFCALVVDAADRMDSELRDDPHMLDLIAKARTVLAAHATATKARPPITPRPMR